jgi:hypothetical protein
MSPKGLRNKCYDSTTFDPIKAGDVHLGWGFGAGFCIEAQIAPDIAAPLAVVAVLARVLLQSPVILRDIHQSLNAFHSYKRHGDPFGQLAISITLCIASSHESIMR